MRTENPCFNRRTGVNGNVTAVDNLRLEPNSKSFVLLPYHHLELVTFETGDGQDTLTLLFLNRTVRITGKNLRDLGIALQDRNVEFVKPMPERYTAIAGGDVAITAITIEENKEIYHA